jgi:hypothetical protein
MNQSATGYCYDVAGNRSAAATVSGVNIDSTDPTVVITSPLTGATYARNQLVVASYSCVDALSGIRTCIGDVPSGQLIDTSKKANNARLTVTATDKAGNTSRQSVTYSVK